MPIHRRQFLATAAIAAAGARQVEGQTAASPTSGDWRNIRNGWTIPDEHYADQPYVVVTNEGHWVCTMTTGGGVEGQHGQHVVSLISRDRGRTWSAPIDIEPADGPEASWVMPLMLPSGRIYAFYTYNAENVREVPGAPGGMAKRVDTLGAYCFKYSDDHGRTWSAERHEIPMRQMAIDRGNNFAGKVLLFWGVGKPILARGYAIFGFAKVGRWGQPGTMVESQGCFLRSDNILTERDPRKIRWELLPDGDHGLRAPKGPVSDEANLVELSNGSLYATYRTIDGYNCHAYSADRGHSWTPPAYATYTPGGRRIKHPRAANFVKKFGNGNYLLWFHNYGGGSVHLDPAWQAGGYYRNRNPAWISGGVEVDGKVHWSQPELLLYDDDPAVRISYPDFIEDGGRFYVTETQKEIARVHEIDRSLLDHVWNQHRSRTVARDGLILPGEHSVSADIKAGEGFSLDFWVRFRDLTAGQVVATNWDERTRRGIRLETNTLSSLTLTFSDGTRVAKWESDPGTHQGTMRVGEWQHVSVIVDGGPKLICFVVDGVLNDGGPVRQFGWGRFDAEMESVPIPVRFETPATNAVPRRLAVRGEKVYRRALRISEAVGNWRAGMRA